MLPKSTLIFHSFLDAFFSHFSDICATLGTQNDKKTYGFISKNGHRTLSVFRPPRTENDSKRVPKGTQKTIKIVSKMHPKKHWKITWFLTGFGTLFGSQNGSKISENYTLGPLWVAVDSRWVASGPQGRLWVPFGSHLGRLGSISWSILVILALKINLKLTMSYILYKNL